MDWFRWWHGTVTDPKMQWVARKSKQPVAVVIAVWSCLLEYASDVTHCNADVTRGDVALFDCNDYDVLLGLDDGSVQAVMEAMEQKGMIVDQRIAKWDERQPKREDSSAARVAAHRARKKAESVNDKSDEQKRDVTQCNAQDKDIDRDKENTKTLKPNTNAPATACALAEHDPIDREFETSVPLPQKQKPARKPKPADAQIVLPKWVPADLWANWLETRKAKRSPNTESALMLSLQQLDNMRQQGQSPADVLRQSIMRGWSGLFDLPAFKSAAPAKPAFNNKPLPKTREQMIGDATENEDGSYAF